eukprot:228172_1
MSFNNLNHIESTVDDIYNRVSITEMKQSTLQDAASNSTPIYHFTDQKTEQEEEKYNINESDLIISFDFKENANFVAPKIDDYMKCKGDIEDCNAIQRIIHLLQYYKSMNNEEQSVLLYEYIMSLSNYNIQVVKQELQPKDEHVKGINSSKFMTSFLDDNNAYGTNSYYAFGQQYRYTDHFKNINHPWFVKTKYSSINDELFMYFKQINAILDKHTLLSSQEAAINSLPSYLQPKAKRLLEQQYS